jgi:hypothetical protein
VEIGDIVHGSGKALIGGGLIKIQRLGQILRHAAKALFMVEAQHGLRAGMACGGLVLQHRQGGGMVARGIGGAGLQHGQIFGSLGMGRGLAQGGHKDQGCNAHQKPPLEMRQG